MKLAKYILLPKWLFLYINNILKVCRVKRKLTFIDLFSGAGGLSEGFIRAGYEAIAHVEIDASACYTLKTRSAFHYLMSIGKINEYKKYLKGKMTRNELYSLIPEKIMNSVINLPISEEHNKVIHGIISDNLGGRHVDLIIGGPPCQAYSVVGRARSDNGMEGDPRNYLYMHYADYLKKYSPKAFVFENVLGLKSANEGKYLQHMKERFSEAGYVIQLNMLDAKNFGVLQTRKRIIIIGLKKESSAKFPDLEKFNSGHFAKVGCILSDLPAIQSGEGCIKAIKYASTPSNYLKNVGIRKGWNLLTQHLSRPQNEQDKKIYKIAVQKWNLRNERLSYNDLPLELKTHNNRDSFLDRFKVVAGDNYFSHTVVAHISKDGHHYIHPDEKQNRSLSIREAARLQSFPDDYYFESEKEMQNRTAAFRQIGNAVPVLMAQKIAEIMMEVI